MRLQSTRFGSSDRHSISTTNMIECHSSGSKDTVPMSTWGDLTRMRFMARVKHLKLPYLSKSLQLRALRQDLQPSHPLIPGYGYPKFGANIVYPLPTSGGIYLFVYFPSL